MNGDDFIDAVGVILGMYSVETDSEPTRAQILMFINTAQKILAVKYRRDCYELMVSTSSVASGVSNVLWPIALLDTDQDPDSPLSFLDRDKYLDEIATGKGTADRPIWTFKPHTSIDNVLRLEWAPTSITNVSFEFIQVPVDFTDASSEPTGRLPIRYEGEHLALAAQLAKYGDDKIGALIQKERAEGRGA